MLNHSLERQSDLNKPIILGNIYAESLFKRMITLYRIGFLRITKYFIKKMLNYPLYRVTIILSKHSVIWWYRCIYVAREDVSYKHIFFSLFFKDSSTYEEFTRFGSHNPEGIFEN